MPFRPASIEAAETAVKTIKNRRGQPRNAILKGLIASGGINPPGITRQPSHNQREEPSHPYYYCLTLGRILEQYNTSVVIRIGETK